MQTNFAKCKRRCVNCTRCPNASGFSASILKTGKPSSNTRVFPEQTAYELLRPIVLFGDPATQRAKETGEPHPTLERKADAFEEQGLVNNCSHLEVACLCGAEKATEEVGNPPTPSRLSMGPRLPLGLSHVRDVRGTALDGTDAEDTAILSHTIVFTGKDQVEFVKEPVRDPGSGEV